ncbi:protein LLP-like [Mya arenaria]|nr:protein LLP-like [Mya arenaria]
MAKSLRSKHKRKMRAIKREKYGKKELETLKKTLQKATADRDVVMQETCTVKDADVVRAEAAEKMETNKAAGKFHPKTMKNEHGNYPAWMNQRKLRKVKKEQKRTTKLIAKKKKK